MLIKRKQEKHLQKLHTKILMTNFTQIDIPEQHDEQKEISMYHYIFIVGMGVVCCAACIPVVVWFLRGCQDTPGKLCELLDFRNYLIHFIQTDGRMDGQMDGRGDGWQDVRTDGRTPSAMV